MDASPDRFGGRVAVVTGASRGIGAGIAERLAAEGATLVLAARTLDEHPVLPGSLNETAERCRSHGADVSVVTADMADEASRAAVIPSALDAYGRVDIVVNNAAAAIYKRIDDYPLRHRRLMTEVNVQAPIDIASAALPGMKERGDGWIVNVSSGSAIAREGPPWDLSAGLAETIGFYGATKAMLNRVTQALGAELHGTGVRVNSIEPRAAVISEGADAKAGHFLKEEQIEALEAMVEATLVLCDCDVDHTAKIEVSLDLLERLGTTVMALNGNDPHPGGFRRTPPA